MLVARCLAVGIAHHIVFSGAAIRPVVAHRLSAPVPDISGTHGGGALQPLFHPDLALRPDVAEKSGAMVWHGDINAGQRQPFAAAGAARTLAMGLPEARLPAINATDHAQVRTDWQYFSLLVSAGAVLTLILVLFK